MMPKLLLNSLSQPQKILTRLKNIRRLKSYELTIHRLSPDGDLLGRILPSGVKNDNLFVGHVASLLRDWAANSA